MSIVNVAFIGCGRIADLHAVGYQRDERARIHTVCDRGAGLAERRAKEWGAERFTTSSDDVLADPAIDGVEILTPQPSHEPLTVAALGAGKHVALQKPMTIDLASADRMIEAASRSRRVFKVTENYVFYPPIVRAKELLDEGRIGEPLGIRIKLIAGPTGGWDVPASAWQWRVQEAAEGRGFITFDHGHHLWSTAWYLMGEFERVTAWIDSIDGVVDAPAVVMWKHREGKRYGTCDLVHGLELNIPSKYYANDEWIEITGNRGVLFVRRCTGNIHDGPVLSLFDGQDWTHFEDLADDWAEGFAGATRNFVDAIRGEASPRLTGTEAREVLRFSLALQKSARLRREVLVDELDSRVGALHTFGKRMADTKDARGGKLLRKIGLGANHAKYAPQARALTEELVTTFDRKAAEGVDTVIAIHLTPDAGVEEKLSLTIKDGDVRLEMGELPEDAKFTLMMPAGTWAAILMKKTRIESALFQGKIKFEGPTEQAMKLREIFGF